MGDKEAGCEAQGKGEGKEEGTGEGKEEGREQPKTVITRIGDKNNERNVLNQKILSSLNLILTYPL